MHSVQHWGNDVQQGREGLGVTPSGMSVSGEMNLGRAERVSSSDTYRALSPNLLRPPKEQAEKQFYVTSIQLL